MLRTKSILLALLGMASALSARAQVVTPISYDMPNGQGVASGGNFNYWDLNYNGTGNTSVDSAPLAGGRGDLTDGVVATDNWFNVENLAGTGPYVGWRDVNPTITFHFSQELSLNAMFIDADDSDGAGGVSYPLAIVVNGGSPIPLSDPAGSAPHRIVINLGGINADGLAVQLLRRNTWVFASEFSFWGVPEPSSAALFGLASVALLCRRKR